MEYSKEKLNEILLSKNLNDFYLAIVESKLDTLNEDYDILDEDTEKLIEELLAKIDNEEE